jgi:LmbE family N-acetylglucosaminyl deacetylase
MRHVWLSPHLDDAALSSGGTIAALTKRGDEVLVVNVCTAFDPNAPLSELAIEIHRRWGLAAEEVIASRKAEDRAALAILGARSTSLDMLDAIYRRPDRYTSFEALFGEVAPDDRADEEIERRLAPIASGELTIHAPLGVGRHIDHQLVHKVARRLALAGRAVLFYEDLPYALESGELEQRLAVLGGGFSPEGFDVSDSFDRKIASIAAYRSQIHELFGSHERMVERITAHAEAVAASFGKTAARWERRWAMIRP